MFAFHHGTKKLPEWGKDDQKGNTTDRPDTGRHSRKVLFPIPSIACRVCPWILQEQESSWRLHHCKAQSRWRQEKGKDEIPFTRLEWPARNGEIQMKGSESVMATISILLHLGL